MDKPATYNEECRKLRNHELKRTELSPDVLYYMRYIDFCNSHKDHPELKAMNREQFEEAKKKFRQDAISKWCESMNNKSDEEKAEINRKKGSYYNNMTPEQKKKQNEELRKRSNNFWNGMTDDERERFGKYRESLVPDDVKAARNKRFIEGGKRYMESLTPEQIEDQIQVMNNTREELYTKHPELAEKRNRLLRENNEKFFNKMSPNEIRKFYANLAQLNRDRLKDPIERAKAIERLRKGYLKYLENLSPEEKGRLQKENKLTKRFERQFHDSILSNDFYLEKELLVKGYGTFKRWDYALHNISDDKVVVVVDLDGSYNHGDKYDYDGTHSTEETDEKRGYFIPDGAKVCIIQEKRFIQGFEELMHMAYENYDDFIKELFDKYSKMKFPYPHYSVYECEQSYLQLCKLDPDNKYVSLNNWNREGDRIIQTYHHSIYHAHTKDKPSPYNAWSDPDLLMKVIKNRTLYRSTIDPNKILQGFNVSKVAPKVSVFSAGRAKLILNKYAKDYDNIFDPFSGFSGRMLGAISLGKKYIGQDISPIHIHESKEIIALLKRCNTVIGDTPDVSLQIADSFKSTGKYDCLFTCPPYGDKEVWEGEDNLPTRSCDDWIDICLKNYKCKRYVFVVDETEKYKDYIAEPIRNRSHFGVNNEYIIVID